MQRFLCLLCCISYAYAQTAIFPGGVATDQDLKVQVNAVQTSLLSSITSMAGTAQVISCAGIVANTLATIDTEIVADLSCIGNTLTFDTGSPGCTSGRACDNSAAAAHNVGAPVSLFVEAWHHNALRVEVEALESALNVNLTLSGTLTVSGNYIVANRIWFDTAAPDWYIQRNGGNANLLDFVTSSNVIATEMDARQIGSNGLRMLTNTIIAVPTVGTDYGILVAGNASGQSSDILDVYSALAGTLYLGVSASGTTTIHGATMTAVAPTVSSGQVGVGSTVGASSSCGSLSGAAGCWIINVAGTAHYVPYY
jgi:hypothetical protein